MKIAVIGATGNCGRALTRAALNEGHRVTAIVRDPRKLDVSPEASLSIEIVDLADHEALTSVLRGHDVIINAAGHASDVKSFVTLVKGVVEAAEAALGDGGRLWIFGGAALLNVPGSDTVTIDLPGVPREYEAHRSNLHTLERTRLDWSIACPGPMTSAPDGKPTEALITSTDRWAVPLAPLLLRLPKIALSLAFKRSVPRMTIYYEDVARVILDNLGHGGPTSGKRVGIALPEGLRRTKTDPMKRFREARKTTEAS